MLVAGVLAVLATAACGSDEPGGKAGRDLLDRLSPVGTPTATVVDLARVRKELGLPADFGGATGSREAAQQRFDSIVAMAYPIWSTPLKSAVRDAVDLGRVSAVANNGVGRQAVTVLATGQKLGEITAALKAGGYTEDNGVWRAPAGNRVTAAAAVGGGDGFLVTGADAATVRSTARGEGTGFKGRVRELIDQLDAPAAAAVDYPSGCVDAAAVADDIAGQKGRIMLIVPGASTDRVRTGEIQSFTVDTSKVEGDKVTVTLTHARAEITPLQFVGGERSVTEVYGC
ncbi:hypothetical protein GCM10010532_030150 [Dactylosporangium siamense]|uniref:Uncharacterized protein n=2 Tax=Dactylosporangium siamense TaxID=685454 RepID=A0A919U642_9ACTN|nr:hypothetical protein Dsi01nite_020750 [Dactylosporangium siamense]